MLEASTTSIETKREQAERHGAQQSRPRRSLSEALVPGELAGSIAEPMHHPATQCLAVTARRCRPDLAAAVRSTNLIRGFQSISQGAALAHHHFPHKYIYIYICIKNAPPPMIHPYLELHGTCEPTITVLITVLITRLGHLRGLQVG